MPLTTTTVRAHYDQHLGPIYSWMIGSVDRATQNAREELRAAGVPPGTRRTAIDLGSGPGPHAIALAEAGYAVTAIDTCVPLLDELRMRAAGHLAITCIEDDMLKVRDHFTTPVDVVTCMGDTLTHLPSAESVEQLFEAVAGILAPGGLFLSTFRDYSEHGPVGIDRFIPVRQDDTRILVCMVEYHDTTIDVHDLVHERIDGEWRFRASAYRKIRLTPSWAQATLVRLGLDATVDRGPRGMVRLIASRPK
jgi:SAM-dependent methyltransferase